MVNHLTPVHRNTDPITSVWAATKITQGGQRISMMRRILWYVEDCPGAVAGEIALGLELTSWQVMKRLSDLKNQGLIHQDGTKEWDGYHQGRWWISDYTPLYPRQISFYL